jgi:DNA-binding LytR/AlgR family response regulator
LTFSPELNSREASVPQKTAASSILLRKGKKLIPVNVSKIDWIESDGNYLDIFVGDDRYTMRKSLKAILESLSSDDFIKIHKQYIVRITAIEEVFLSDNKVKVRDTFLPIGRKYKSELLDKLDDFD